MIHTIKRLSGSAAAILTSLVLALPLSAQAGHHEEAAEGEPSGRAMALTVEAVVTEIDLETRQVTLQGPGGAPFTITAREQVVKLEDVSVGDSVVATYLAALEGELREPTEEEKAEPWVVLEDAGISDDPEQPAIGGARLIRAVCTIEGMNRVLGTVTLMDPRGKLHLLGDVEPGKMEGVTLGQTVVVVYTEALALSLEHNQAE
jgi:hypothetical protein